MGTESYNKSLGDSSEIKMYGGVLQCREMSMFGWMKSGDEGWILVRAKGNGQLNNYYQQYWNRGWNTDLLDTVKIFLTEEALYHEVKEHEIMERSVADKTIVFVLNKAGSHVDDNGLYHRNSTSIQDVRLSTWMSRYLDKVIKKQIGEDPLKTVDEPKNITEHRKRIEEIHSIYKEKNAKYGNSFDKSLDKYGVVAWQVRNGDKMNRLDTLLDDLLVKGDDGTYKLLDTLEGTNESIHDTLMDTAGYIIMLDMWLVGLDKGGK